MELHEETFAAVRQAVALSMEGMGTPHYEWLKAREHILGVLDSLAGNPPRTPKYLAVVDGAGRFIDVLSAANVIERLKGK